MHFTKETLNEYCKNYSITIINEVPSNLKRETILEGKCLTCNNNFNKSFRSIIKNGAYCKEYETNGKKHRHYVDFFISKENKCIEVKSTFTLNNKKDNVFDKQKYAKEQGYLYEIWVYDKGQRIDLIY